MTPTFELVLSQARALPRSERLRLASVLMFEEPAHSVSQAERSAVVAEVCGKYAATAPSSEKFMAWKREEVDLEEQRHQRLFGQQTEKPE